MCLTIPGKILAVKDGVATIQSSREKVQIDMGLVFGAKIDDWVLYATNRAVKLISEDDAKEIISLLEDKYRPINTADLPKKFVNLLTKISNSKFLISNKNPKFQYQITKKDIEYLLSLKDMDCLETMFSEANLLRKQMIDDFVCIHGIIEFSNYCRNNCLYCGIRRDNKNIQRYRMNKKEIIKTAKEAVNNEGYKLIVLQSGEDMSYLDDDLLNIIKNIKKQAKVFIFLSVGNRSRQFYKNAFLAGATGSLFRFETSNEKLYAKMHPGESLDNRLQLVRYQLKLGYYVASGSLVGLPDQTISDVADDLLLIKKLGVPMISSGPYIPAKDTPLEKSEIRNPKSETNSKFKIQNSKRAQIELFLKYIAIARFLMPEVKIPVTTALETLDPKNGRHRGLLAGANALMFNLTPEKFAGEYKIYDNKYREREKVWQKYGLFKGEESYEMLRDRMKSDLLHTDSESNEITNALRMPKETILLSERLMIKLKD